MLELFEDKIVGETPAPFYLTQEEVDSIASQLREHKIFFDFIDEVAKWDKDSFPEESRSIGAPHGLKAQIEYIRTVANWILSKASKND